MKLEAKTLLPGIAVTLAILLFIYFGFSSVIMLLWFTLVSFAFYMLLKHFDLDTIEKLIFSVIFSVGIFSTYTYWLALLIGSIRIGMSVSLALIIGLAVAFHFYQSPKKQLYIILTIVAIGLILWFLAYAIVINNLSVPGYVQQFYDCVKNGTDTLSCGQKY